MKTLWGHSLLVRHFAWTIGIVTLLLGGCGGTEAARTSPTAATTSRDTPTPTIAATPTIASGSASMRLQLPSIGLDAAVEELGVTPDGSLAMPTKPANVGWYNAKLSSSMYLGDAPGAGGNSVWAGYQGTTFNKLPQVNVGADVYVVTGTAGRLHYQVVSKTSYEPAKMLSNMGQIIDPKARPPSKEWMTMITADKVNDKNEVVSFLVVVAQRADQ